MVSCIGGVIKFNCSYSEIRELHTIIENPKNNNKHPDRQIEMLAKIIDYQGQRSPIVISKRSGFVVKGHGRLLAIKQLGWKSAAVDIQDYKNEAQEYADMIADNKIAELAEFDESLMIEEIKNLDIEDFELLGLNDFSFMKLDIELEDKDDKIENDSVKLKLEVTLKNELDLADLRDDLISKGYIVKEL